MRLGAQLGALEHDGVAAGQRRGDGARGQDHGGVPWRDAQHHAGGLPHAHGKAAGHVGRNDLARDLRGERRGLGEDAGRQVHVEAGPQRRGAGLARHGLHEGVGARFERVRGLQQQGAAFVGAGLRPGDEGALRGVDGGDCVGRRGGGGARGDAAVQRVAALEGGAAGGRAAFAVDEHGDVGHGCPLQERKRKRVFRPRPGRPGARRRNAAAPALRPRRRRARVRARSRGRRPARPCARSVRP
ncbi:hypothetical protein D3C71_1154410 [compost metagenome]